MKILMTANTSWNLAHFRMGIIKSCVERGHDVVALAPYDQTVSQLEKKGLRYIPLEVDNKGRSPFRDLQLLRSMQQVFTRERPDIILNFTIKNNIYGALAAARTGAQFLPNLSGLVTAFLSAGWLETLVTRLYRGVFQTLPVVFFQNADDRDLFVSRGFIAKYQASVFPGSGIDLNAYAPVPLLDSADRVVFLMVARLLEDKGVVEFVTAARKLKARYPQAVFRLVGEVSTANCTAISATQAQAWHAEGVVEYLGVSDNVKPQIAAADCVVLPSYREGTPRTLLEGAAMARPLIATDVPGCREVVQHGVNGYLCPPRDADALGSIMEQLIQDGPDARCAKGRAERQLIEEQFDEGIVVNRYLEVIERRTTVSAGSGAQRRA